METNPTRSPAVRGLASVIALVAMLGGGAGPASAARLDGPEGIDLNELHATPHRIVTGFYQAVLAGEHWVTPSGQTVFDVVPN